MANYLQWTRADEGYLVAKTVRTRKAQVIALSVPVDANAPDAVDQRIIQDTRRSHIKAIVKKKAKLDSTLKKGYATVCDQCSQEVQDKLEASDDWDCIQQEQLLHELITKIERTSERLIIDLAKFIVSSNR